MTIIEIEENFVLRDASEIASLDDFKNIINVINSSLYLKKHIIETELYSEKKIILKHRKIRHIIHSEEYTTSMAYDVTETAINIALDLIQYGIYANDLLPHNFTFENGKWILYDFCSFGYNKKGFKTQIRGLYNISFSAFELLKFVNRSYLKYYFLTRIKFSRLYKMIPFLSLKFAMSLFLLKRPDICLKYIKNVFNSYKKNQNKKIYDFTIDDKNKQIYNYVDNIISECSDIFCIGCFSGDWAVFSNKNIQRCVYIADYDKCDEYYNYITQNNISNISTGVLQPLTEDDKIDDNIQYRALYDSFTMERFVSDAVFFDFDEI